MGPFRIFISHREEDRPLAIALRGHLVYLGDTTVQCLVSDKIPGGAEWLDWISNQTREADLLLFLYTTSDHDWTWCVLEIGRFQGAKEAQGRQPQVAWFIGEGLPTPAFVANYQYYKTSRDSPRSILGEGQNLFSLV
jgi:hypothetical protein